MKRRWFQADDGRFYRNTPLILDELLATPWWRWRKLKALDAECIRSYDGFEYITELGRGDVLVRPAPMREAYPSRPAFWSLDEKEVPRG